jgi:putative copper resistance protein D
MPRVIVTWPLLVALLAVGGTSGFGLTLGGGKSAHRDEFLSGLIPLWRGLIFLVAVLSPLLLLAVSAAMATTGWRQALALVPTVLHESHVGRVWEWRLALTALLLIAALIPMQSATRAWSMLIGSSAVLLTESITSHAVDIGPSAISIYFVHQLAAALWFGAIFGLAWGAWHEKLGAKWVEFAAPGVSRLAGWTVLALTLSGLFLAYHGLAHDPARVFYATYGRILLVKLAAAAIVLMIGAYNRFVLMPALCCANSRDRLIRNVTVESILLCSVIGLAALLANTPPAH